MQVIHNDNIENIDCNKENIVLNKWKDKVVTGDEKIEKPNLCIFNNIVEACKLINKHINNKSKIVLHTDVDIDGIGSTYILDRSLTQLGCKPKQSIINKDKVHGIQQKHADVYNQIEESKRPNLLIISDSSTNELEIIKQFNFDVLVIDHHDILIDYDKLSGKCNNNKNDYIIVNNTIDNLKFEKDKKSLTDISKENFNNIEKYIGDSRMSCGLVIYELLRVYSRMYGLDDTWLEDLVLYQWAAVTLFTDAIPLLTRRNQWYMSKTLNADITEPTLKITMNIINKFKNSLDKTYIDYSFAPVINKAIRAGKSLDAMKIILRTPDKIEDLYQYKELQDYAINSVIYTNYTDIRELILRTIEALQCTQEEAISNLKSRNIVIEPTLKEYKDDYILEDITSKNINTTYTGVIAGKLSGMYHKNAVCYSVDDEGYCKGSFRGRNAEIKYRSKFLDILNTLDTPSNNELNNIFAEGHEPAFGFRCLEKDIGYIMNQLNYLDKHTNTKEYISTGDIPQSEYGIYHILDFNELRANGDLYRIAIGNSRLQGSDVIYIKIPAKDAILQSVNKAGTLYKYSVYGMECKAFKLLTGTYYKLYLEFSNSIQCFLRDYLS